MRSALFRAPHADEMINTLSAAKRGLSVIIAGAGGRIFPVCWLDHRIARNRCRSTKALDGLDSLLSIVQCPRCARGHQTINGSNAACLRQNIGRNDDAQRLRDQLKLAADLNACCLGRQKAQLDSPQPARL